MTVRIPSQLNEDGTIIVTVEIESEPDFIVGLRDSNGNINFDRISSGMWMILCAAPWNPLDLASVGTSVEFVKVHEGKYRLGIVPFNDISEVLPFLSRIAPGLRKISTFATIVHDSGHSSSISCPESVSHGFTPYWIFLRDGVVTHFHQGPLTDAELFDTVIRCFS